MTSTGVRTRRAPLPTQVAVVESLLFYLASAHADAVLRLLVCAFELFGAGVAEDGMTTATRGKACRRVVAALKSFPKDARVQLAGISAVVNLAVDDVGRKALADFGACAAVLDAVVAHGVRARAARGSHTFERLSLWISRSLEESGCVVLETHV